MIFNESKCLPTYVLWTSGRNFGPESGRKKENAAQEQTGAPLGPPVRTITFAVLSGKFYVDVRGGKKTSSCQP